MSRVLNECGKNWFLGLANTLGLVKRKKSAQIIYLSSYRATFLIMVFININPLLREAEGAVVCDCS
jgi:hypothetical protein